MEVRKKKYLPLKSPPSKMFKYNLLIWEKFHSKIPIGKCFLFFFFTWLFHKTKRRWIDSLGLVVESSKQKFPNSDPSKTTNCIHFGISCCLIHHCDETDVEFVFWLPVWNRTNISPCWNIVVISVCILCVKIILKFRWESGFLEGGVMEPPMH